jgi:tetratricopeptide (TPR) repeat protein
VAESGGGCHARHGGRGEGTRLLAAGLQAAWSGDLAAAERAAADLQALAGEGDGPAYRKGASDAMQKEVLALVALKKGNAEEALKLLAEAAEIEDRMAPPSGPPEPIKPAPELYGEVLLEQGKAEEALRQFDRALLRMPNRSASRLGAARAAARLGRTEEARGHYAALAESWRQADPGTPELAEVKSYLEGGSPSRPAAR